MAVQGGEDVYASLLLTDTYLPGALVLAHSLRDAGTTKKLAILVTLDTVSVDVLTQLKAVYDYVIPVSRIQNEHPANLDLMNRPDLHSAFTKINLWRQTQFRKIVYVDADIVAYRAPDELFQLDHPFSAAPDIGWPDLFNTGLMVLTPNMGDYYAMMAMAQRGISFDGADQGLLNMYFKNDFNRLSFTYNVTPSAHYQYIPAYQHFQSSINLVHFIGPDKPWIQGRDQATGSSPFDQMVGRWWAVYDRHYRKEANQPEAPQSHQRAQEIVQYFVKGEYQPTVSYVVPVGEPPRDESGNFYGQHDQPPPGSSHGSLQYPQQHEYSHQSHHHDHHHHHHSQDHHHHHHHHHPQPSHPEHSHESSSHHPSHHGVSSHHHEGPHAEAREDQASDHQQWDHPPPAQSEHKPEPQPQPEPTPSWDAQRHPPPADSKPEAANFPQTHYAMSSDTAPFVPPERYPSPPKNMWYEVPKEPPAHRTTAEKPKPVFPWEANQPRPTRVFPDQHQHQQQQQHHHQQHHHQHQQQQAQQHWHDQPSQAEPAHQGGSGGGGIVEEHRAPRSWSEPPQHQQQQQANVSLPPVPGTAAWNAQRQQQQQQPSREHPQTPPRGPSASSSHAVSTAAATAPSGAPAAPGAPSAPPPIPQPMIPFSETWSSFSLTNAWDTVPEINRYVDTIQKHRRQRSRNMVLGGGGRGGGNGNGAAGAGDPGFSWRDAGAGGTGGGVGRRGSKVTDFPSEDDRPSLPVTPAPIRRPRFSWGGSGAAASGPGSGGVGGGEDDEDAERLLPAAEGVPAQSDWVCVHGLRWGPADCLCDLTNVLRYHKDPAAQLQKLAREQSALLFQRLGGGGGGAGGSGGGESEDGQEPREIPSRALPFGSEDVRSPTYVAPVPGPPPQVVSPRPVKPQTGTSPVDRILEAAPELVPSPSQDAPSLWAAPGGKQQSPPAANAIPPPSYQGPGLVFEKGEDYPTFETPALPTEEEQDVLET